MTTNLKPATAHLQTNSTAPWAGSLALRFPNSITENGDPKVAVCEGRRLWGRGLGSSVCKLFRRFVPYVVDIRQIPIQ